MRASSAGLRPSRTPSGGFADEARTADDVRLILDNTGQSVSTPAGGEAPLLRATRETGQLREWLPADLSALGELTGIRGNRARIVFTIPTAANAQGVS